jgi:hypothetical protein
MTEAELKQALQRPGQTVGFVAKRSAVDRMPKTPLDMRRPGYKTPLTSGGVLSVSGGRVRVQDSHGYGGTIAVDDALYVIDLL